METLSAELHVQICSYLPRADLRTLTRTSSSLAAAAKPSLFEILTFHGDDRISHQHSLLRRHCEPYGLLSTYPVKLSCLETVVDKIIDLGIAKYAITFQYSPKLYLANFWTNYRNRTEEWIERDLDVEIMDDGSDAWENDEEWGYVGLRRQMEARRRRSEEERDAISKAELCWHRELQEQNEKKDANHAALVRLFQNMPKLKSLQVLEWSCADELQKHGIESGIDEEVQCQFSNHDTLNLHLETLGASLQEAGVRIKHLFLPTVLGLEIVRTSAVQYLFSALTSLSLDLPDPTDLLVDYTGHPAPFRTLIRCARNSLERLEFNNSFCSHPHLPHRGEHLLEKLWGDDPGQEDSTFVFPRLKHLKLASIILYAPSLIKFLRAQLCLQSAAFSTVHIPTPGYGWSDVAAALPPTCRFLRIDRCGGQTAPRVSLDTPPHPDIAYNQIPPFLPRQSSWPASCGWRISDAFIENEAFKQACKILSIVPQQLMLDIDAVQRGERSSTNLALSELLERRVRLKSVTADEMQAYKDGRRMLDAAEYERI